jgi:hypothetical protein
VRLYQFFRSLWITCPASILQSNSRSKAGRSDLLCNCAVRHGLDNVAQAVREFAVLYERVEAQKAQAVLELEEKRQAFEREMEAIRMQARMQAQAQGYQD